MIKCTSDFNHKKFIGTAHVTQDWELDENGNFNRAIQECVEVTHSPDKNDVITCAICGSDAVWED